MSSRLSRSGGISMGKHSVCKKGLRETGCFVSCSADRDALRQSSERPRELSSYSQSFKFMFLQSAQQLWLQLETNVTDFI